MQVRLTRRQLFLAAGGAGLTASLATPGQAAAQTKWPTKAVRLIVPSTAGGVLDAVTRILQPSLTKELGQAIVIENKPGADFAIGAQAVARSAADGYTFLVGSIPLTTNPALKKVPYDTLKDFEPVVNMGNASAVVVVPPALGVKTLKDFIALAKSKPGDLNFANAAVGSLGHINLALLEQASGIKTTAVLYPGQGASVVDLLANRVNFAMLSPIVALPHVQSGALVPLAIVAPERSPVLPDVPTMKELGYPKVDVETWVGILAPAGTPKPIVARLNQAVQTATKDAQVRVLLERQGVTAAPPHTPEDFRKVLQQQMDRWPILFKQANIKAES